MRGQALVTGAAGFLGGYIARELSDAGWEVAGLDRVGGGAELKILHMELPSEDLLQLVTETAPALVVHTAGPASVSDSIARPRADFANSVPIFFDVLDAVRVAAPSCRVVLLSSAAVYGEPQSLPITEDQPLRPLSPYGYHKMLCERLNEEFSRIYGLKTCALRIFSAYGSGLRRQVLWDVCCKARCGGRVELFGTGEETRDFVHVSDVATAVRAVAERAACDGEAYNVATGMGTSIRHLAELLVAALGSRTEVRFSGVDRRGDPHGWSADITRLVKLGWRPTVDIERGVADYAQWFLKQECH